MNSLHSLTQDCIQKIQAILENEKYSEEIKVSLILLACKQTEVNKQSKMYEILGELIAVPSE